MREPIPYALLADAVLVVHVLYLGFVIGGLLLVAVGGLRRWSWVRNPWFRAAHLAAIAGVTLLAWTRRPCPLTVLESEWRVRAGTQAYADGFIAHWLARLLYWDAPAWVFSVAYGAFGVLVVAAWWRVRPRPFRRPLSRRAADADAQPPAGTGPGE